MTPRIHTVTSQRSADQTGTELSYSAEQSLYVQHHPFEGCALAVLPVHGHAHEVSQKVLNMRQHAAALKQ